MFEMEYMVDPSRPVAQRPDAFADTRWSLVAAARDAGGDGRDALAGLCEAYWYPVFAYVRRCGHAPETAYGLTQTYFSHLVEALRREDPAEFGHFRTFLLARLNRFLVEHGPDARVPTPDAGVPSPHTLAVLEHRQRHELAPEATPERAFQRCYALEVLARSLGRLRAEANQGGRLPMFEQLEPFLTGDPQPGQHEQLARELGSRPIAVVIAIRRLRQRFRELVDEELAHTVTGGADLASERSALLSILGGAT